MMVKYRDTILVPRIIEYRVVNYGQLGSDSGSILAAVQWFTMSASFDDKYWLVMVMVALQYTNMSKTQHFRSFFAFQMAFQHLCYRTPWVRMVDYAC